VYVEHNIKDWCSSLYYLGLLASSGRIFGIRAWPVIGLVDVARARFQAAWPPVLFDHCHFRRCNVELEQCLVLFGSTSLLSAPRIPALSSSSLFPVIRPFGLAFWADILGASDDFLDNRSTDTTKAAAWSFTGNRT
jgi:hypothetical protein